ncbi:MAG TPA: aspartate carbamoyltransferase regulatory subunit [Clostridiales bacterium]|jgi:aspartate carbamoyltransferase regulatory subunit|nr:aspartate carbamoyltransferase regulatory subunit [Clostridiales bacterium]
MLNVDSLKKGIVIDHIKAGKSMEIYNYLNLDKADYTVALIKNVPSKKMKKKDIIKIENNIDLNLNILGYIDPNITINVIENDKIIKKLKLDPPETVKNVMKCKNPRCITSSESEIEDIFQLIDKEKAVYKCIYCDQIYKRD